MDEPLKIPEIPENSWCGFPNEIRKIIASGLDNNTRLALRACSRRDKELIDSIPWRKMEELKVKGLKNDKWKMTMRQTRWSYLETIKFQSFDEFQEKLSEVIESTDYIKECWLWLPKLPRVLKLTKTDGTPIKVYDLSLIGGAGYAARILRQVQEGVKLYLYKVKENEVFNMKQVVHAENLHIEKCPVQLYQLLEMKATCLNVFCCRGIGLAEINEFIEERFILLKTNNKIKFNYEQFSLIKSFAEVLKGFHSNVEISEQTTERGRAKLVSPFRHDLRVSYYGCRIDIRTIDSKRVVVNVDDRINHHNEEDIYKDKFLFKKLDCIIIEFRDKTKKYSLRINDRVRRLFNSADALQKKLNGKLAVINYVKGLKIKGTNHNWNLGTNGGRITVGLLRLFNVTNIVETVKQVDLGYLKEVGLRRTMKKETTEEQRRIEEEEDERLFDLPQVIGAHTLSVWECYIREDQFFNLNSVNLRFFDENSKCITIQNVNTILKHRVANLNLHEYTVYVDKFDINFEILLEGLDVFSQERGEKHSVTVINSPYPEYQLLVETRKDNILARRIERGQEWRRLLDQVDL